ncbi:Protein YigP (plasmid) [Legionella adelaidensis]|uniref:Ubiquinone biosynthesis accessory factor UbiJ n=1 Tax=Legionella adelaidensis TaxID=45056 RepID=A0A0W0R0Q5_9GAMM|nr:SCP2 sterol-binding domain-containing protein [Legionella adelaidensis]KTC64629.1 SCP-2 sterol transfer family protein [Legionella adelaidensis]VEH86097.1 Protein YigP [Legionella adelaidensis]
MIKDYTLAALQKAINKAIGLDEKMPAKLASLAGKTIEIIITPLNVSFYLTFTSTGIELLPESINPADTVIRSSPLGLIRLSFLPASKVRSLFNDQITISGDVELGQRIKKIFDEIDIDWEGHLAHFTGDVVAYQIGSLIRGGNAIKERLSNSLKHSMTEYLQEELQLFPPREEIEDFFKEIDELSLRVERLKAQFEKMEWRKDNEIH